MPQSLLHIPERGLYLLMGDQRQGPFTMHQLQEKFAQSAISRATYLWFPGLVNWITVGDIPSFDRREAGTPPDSNQAPMQDGLWIYDRTKVVAMPLAEVQQMIRDNRFRRAEMIFHEERKRWIRADQHPDLGPLFRPAVPPPVEVAPSLEATTPEVTEAKVQASPTPHLELVPSPAESAPILFPTKEKSGRWNWVFPGVGLASLILMLMLASGFWDVSEILVSIASLTEESPAPRMPASIAPTTSLRVVFPLASDRISVENSPLFSSCRPSGADSFQCTGIPGVQTLNLVFLEARLNRIGVVFPADRLLAEKQFMELARYLGAEEERAPAGCGSLSDSQKQKYRNECTSGKLMLISWSRPGQKAVAMVMMTPAGVKPLELWASTINPK